MQKLLVLTVAFLSSVLAGCSHSTAYVGTYGLVLTDEMKQGIDAGRKMMMGAPKERRDQFEHTQDLLADKALEINADSTYSAVNPNTGQEMKGTYTVEGNTLLLSEPHGKTPGKFTFNASDQTLTIFAGGSGVQMVFKKKN